MENKINSNDIKTAIKDELATTKEFEWNGFTIRVKHLLSLEEEVEFSDFVTNLCFQSSSNYGYNPEIKEFAIGYATIAFYTNIEIGDIDDMLDIVYQTYLIDGIVAHVNANQLHSLLSSIDEKIEYVTRKNLDTLTSRAAKFFNSVDEFVSAAARLFGDMDGGAIKDILSVIAKDSIDLDKAEELLSALVGDGTKNGLSEEPADKESGSTE